MSAECMVPNEQESLGFCWSPCEAGFTGHGSVCLRKCPDGYKDNGSTCEPPSMLRSTTRAFLQPCEQGQLDQNGDCFEPQTFAWYNQVTGCGCIRKTYAQRLYCATGFSKYNNMCIQDCPTGYEFMKDLAGQVISPYCVKPCPLIDNVKSQRWPKLAGQCVKPTKSRLLHSSDNGTTALLGKPKTMLAVLSGKPSGSTVLERYRKGFTMDQSLQGIGDTISDAADLAIKFGDLVLDPSKWFTNLGDSLKKFLPILAALIVVVFLGPSLLPFIGKGVGAVVQGVGAGAGKVTEGVIGAVGSSATQVLRIPGAQAQAVNDAAGVLARDDAIKQLTAHTQALANAQQQLMKSMQLAAPAAVPA